MNTSIINIDRNKLRLILLFVLIACTLFGWMDAFAEIGEGGDASRFGADQQTGLDIIAFVWFIGRIVMFCALIIGIAWLVWMLISGDRDYWKTAVVVMLIGAFGSAVIEWAAEEGDLIDDDTSYVMPGNHQLIAGYHIGIDVLVTSSDQKVV